MRRIHLGVTTLVALASAHCASPVVGADASPESGTTMDVAAPDATPDVTQRDTTPEASQPDAEAMDASPDAEPDASPDAGPDAGPEAAVDVVTARCGDGVINGTDMCDDGNMADGDGCSATCQPESGFACTAASPSVCTARCGDGMRVGPEAAMNGCDDGNMADGDGCSAMCAIERGFSCMGAPSVCATGCGDGITAGMERCDDGNMNSNDGCSMSCAIEPGFACTGMPSVCATRCGDGVTAGMERCDDSNMADGDGCSAMCAIEPGFACTGAPSVCAPRCGDGVITGSEECDDGFAVGGDGCSASCTREPGAMCAGAPSVCSYTSSYAGMAQTVANTNPAPTDLPATVGTTCRIASVRSTHQWSTPHTFAGDLTINLIGPGGQTALLHNRTGGSTDLDGPYTFALMGTAWAPTGSVYPMGTYAAATLSAFDGTLANGTWTLRVQDLSAGDSGVLSAHQVSVTCQPNRVAVPIGRNCAEILTAAPMSTDGVYNIDATGAGDFRQVYCDMTNGGWTLLYSSNATPTMITTQTPARPMTASMLPIALMSQIAGVASQVHIRTAGMLATRSVTSVANNFAIQSLRAGLTINSNSPLSDPGNAIAGVWTGPMAMTAASLWHSCGPAPYGTSTLAQNMYWACNNSNGLHVGGTHTAWISSGPNENIEIYVR